MNNIIQTIRHTARAATVLLLALLAAQTAGAQGNIRQVSNAAGLAGAFYDPTVSVVNVTDNITDVGDLPTLNHDLIINLDGYTISGDELYFDVGADGSLTINGGGQDGSVGNIISGKSDGPAIYNDGTVTLSHVNITTNSDFAIFGGGTLNIGDNVSFNGWTTVPFNTSNVNIIEGGNYNYDPGKPFAYVVATVNVGGTPHYFENRDIADDYAQKTGGVVDFSLSGDTYTIHTAAGWDAFCSLLADNDKGFFTGKTVRLGADIGTADDPVTRMAGSAYHDFTGTFDGQGNTLTVGYGTADAPFGEQYAAPFRYIEDGCTIKNLHVAGHIYTADKFAGGLAGSQYGTVSIQNCRVSTVIHSSVSGDGTHGGFVAVNNSNSTLTIEGCLFDGRLLGSSTIKCGGFVGWRKDDGSLTITNCLYAPTADDNAVTVGATFARNGGTITNCYYTRTLGDAQGKALHSVTADDDVTLALSGTATEYTVSGITAYEGNQGIKYGTTYYAGSGDEVSLTLSNTATGAPDGYQYVGYTTNAGTLSGSTLTMPDEDVTVSLALAVLPWTGDGSKGNPYIIYNKDQLDLLAHRVNGTHDETCQTNGYKDTYFQLGKDITYTHTTDWDDAECEQENNFEAIGGYYDGNYRSFCGHFDGNNNTISGIRIYKDSDGDADNYQGIFGRTNGADIHDLTLADARITGYDYTGGIVGNNIGGTVTRCHVADDVAVCAVQSGVWNHGGIVGYNRGTIEQCTSAATLTTADAANSMYYGGIAGINQGTLSDNLAIGATVPAANDNSYGAITGRNIGSLQRNYYAACKVNDTPNATGVGCGYIGNADDGYITADVNNDNNPDGAVCINTLALTANLAPDGNFWTTYYNSFLGFTIDKNENACAYTATYGDGQLTLHNLGKEIPKNTAVIIVAENSVVSMATATDLDDFSGTNDLHGVDADTPVADIRSSLGDGTFYVLGMTTVDNEQHFGFHRYTGTTMAAHKAFVHVAGSNARSLDMVFEETTGIESLTPDAAPQSPAADHWFTLDGRRLQAKPTAPGIYVNNGKKVVIK